MAEIDADAPSWAKQLFAEVRTVGGKMDGVEQKVDDMTKKVDGAVASSMEAK